MMIVFKLVRARPVGINPSADVTPQNSARESVLKPHSRRAEKTASVSIRTVRLSDADIDYLQTPDQSLTLEWEKKSFSLRFLSFLLLLLLTTVRLLVTRRTWRSWSSGSPGESRQSPQLTPNSVFFDSFARCRSSFKRLWWKKVKFRQADVQ